MDKDRLRHDLGSVIEKYREVAQTIGAVLQATGGHQKRRAAGRRPFPEAIQR